MTQQALTETPFGIVKSEGLFTIKGMMLPSGVRGSVEVTEGQLDNGRYATQSEWQSRRNATGFGLGSGPLINAVLMALYDNRQTEGVEELRQNFDYYFKNSYWMLTATGITYRAGGELDLVKHDVGTPGERTLETRLVGSSGYPIYSGTDNVTQAILGSSDTDKVAKVYQWVTGITKKPILIRSTTLPNQDREGTLVLGFEQYFQDFVFAVGQKISTKLPARGVRIVPQTTELTR